MTPARAAAWRHLWTSSGLEVVTVQDPTADGDIVWLDEAGAPLHLRYHLEWDRRSCTRKVVCSVDGPDFRRALSLAASGNGEWWSDDGTALVELAGCMDVDLWPTPFTNALPLRRIRIPVGHSVEVTVAYVEAPALTVSPRAQRYTALGDDRYRFESLDDGYSAEIVLAPDHLVQRYEGLFERIG